MNLQFFIGDVEKITDPLYIGRLKVRIFGDHTLDKEILPTDDLPWATVLNDVHSHSTTGKGQTPLGLRVGSKVVGFYLDAAKQRPVILGSIPGKDDVNTLATAQSDHASLTARKEARTTNIATPVTDAKTIEVFGQAVGSVGASISQPFSEPEIPYAAIYPENHVLETTSGHLVELDDTDTKERIHLRHAVGTGLEIHPDGTRVDITKKDAYNIIDGHHYCHIKDNETVTINGSLKVLINTDKGSNDYTIQVDDGGNVNIQVDDGQINLVTGGDGNDINIVSSGDINMSARQDVNIRALGSYSKDIEGNSTEQTTGNYKVNAARIDLNS